MPKQMVEETSGLHLWHVKFELRSKEGNFYLIPMEKNIITHFSALSLCGGVIEDVLHATYKDNIVELVGIEYRGQPLNGMGEQNA